MDVMQNLAAVVIETLRELSENRQSLTAASLSRALRKRKEVLELLGQSRPAQADRSEPNDTSAELDELRTRLRNIQSERRKQLREMEDLQQRCGKTDEFARRSLLTMATMLGSQESEAVAAALDDFRRKLKDGLGIGSLEESLQTLRSLVVQEGLAKEESSEAQPSRWNKWFGRGDAEKKAEPVGESYLAQIQNVYLEILKSLSYEPDDHHAEQSDILQKQVMESKDVLGLLSLNREIITFIHDYGRTLSEERSQISSFITDIGANLIQIEKHFLSSLSLNSKVQNANNQFNTLLDGEMEQIKNCAQISKSLAEFKGLVSSRLAAIKEALESKRTEDKKRWEEAKREKRALEESLQSVKREIELVQAKTKALELETLLDPLTGINNRRAYEQRMNQEMQRFQRYGQSFSLLVFDVDHFKRINDQHGHAVGDRCLKEMIDRIRPILRRSDFLARYGGEEFAVLLPGIDCSRAYQVGEKLRLTIDRKRFQFRGKDIPFTISVGVSEVRKSDEDQEALFQRVDKALYEAKRAGRNRTTAL